jgi:hypothetical protein
MDERIPCPLCRHGNLPENRFCGHCGVLMTSRGQLTPRPEANPTAAIRSLPTNLGPVGKTLAVGRQYWRPRRGWSGCAAESTITILHHRPPPRLLDLLAPSTLLVRAWKKYSFGCRKKGTSRAEALADG